MRAAYSTAMRILALSGAAMLALVGCASSGSSGGSASSSSGGEYNWGINAELSGFVSFQGQSLADGITAYVDQVNASDGINGHKINLVSLDNAGTQSRAAANATQLASVGNVDAMFGGILSSDCSAAQPVVNRYQIPMACLSVDAPNPYVFSLGPDDSRAASALLTAARKVSGKTNPKIAFVYLHTLTVITLANSLKSAATAQGIDLATSQSVSLTATDLSGQISEVVAAHPDVVLTAEVTPGVLTILKGVRAAGIKAPLVWLDGTGNISQLAQGTTDPGVYAFDVYNLVDPSATGSAAKDYISAVTPQIKKDGVTTLSLNNGELATGYMAARAFGEALKSCGYPCAGAKLQTALEKVQLALPGLVEQYAYTPDNHYPFTQMYLYHVVGPQSTLMDTVPYAKS